MSSETLSTSPTSLQKQKSSFEADSATETSPPATVNQRRLERQRFWDSLSRLWLTPGALREFDRRTVRSSAPLPPERTRKEEIDSRQLKRFAKRGGPSLDDLRDYAQNRPGTSSNRTMDSDQSDVGKISSPYDSNFAQILIDSGIYPPGYDEAKRPKDIKKPNNWDEIKARLVSPRASSGFKKDHFRDFMRNYTRADFERDIMIGVVPIIAGMKIPPKEISRFGNLKPLTKHRLPKTQPDLWDGSSLEELHEGIRQDLGPYIVPSTNTTLPCLPNFFLEVKGRKGRADVCQRHILYDGALGARGIHELRVHIIDSKTPSFDENAYTIVASFAGAPVGILKLFTIHPTRPPPGKEDDRKYDFRMTQIGSWELDRDSQAFRQGVNAFRNARDWAREKRTELIAAANRFQDSRIQ